MTSKVMLTMESRIHGDMYVRFGGGLTETYHHKVAKRCWPSPLKEIASTCHVDKELTSKMARNSFATTVTLANNVPMETISKMMGHKSLRQTQHYAKVLAIKVTEDMDTLKKRLAKKKFIPEQQIIANPEVNSIAS